MKPDSSISAPSTEPELTTLTPATLVDARRLPRKSVLRNFNWRRLFDRVDDEFLVWWFFETEDSKLGRKMFCEILINADNFSSRVTLKKTGSQFSNLKIFKFPKLTNRTRLFSRLSVGHPSCPPITHQIMWLKRRNNKGEARGGVLRLITGQKWAGLQTDQRKTRLFETGIIALTWRADTRSSKEKLSTDSFLFFFRKIKLFLNYSIRFLAR